MKDVKMVFNHFKGMMAIFEATNNPITRIPIGDKKEDGTFPYEATYTESKKSRYGRVNGNLVDKTDDIISVEFFETKSSKPIVQFEFNVTLGECYFTGIYDNGSVINRYVNMDSGLDSIELNPALYKHTNVSSILQILIDM